MDRLTKAWCKYWSAPTTGKRITIIKASEDLVTRNDSSKKEKKF